MPASCQRAVYSNACTTFIVSTLTVTTFFDQPHNRLRIIRVTRAWLAAMD
jgi:hypothetical protein